MTQELAGLVKMFEGQHPDRHTLEVGLGDLRRWLAKIERLQAALKPFADLAGKLDGAPNLIGLLTEEDFKSAASALADEQSAEVK